MHLTGAQHRTATDYIAQSEKHVPPVSRCLTLSTNRTCRFSGASKDLMLGLGVLEAGQL
jgi:hypothetical protein